MFKFFKTKQNKQLNVEKKKSKIVTCNFVKEDNFWNNIFDNPYTLTGSFTIIGIDEQEYKIVATIDEYRKMNITVYTNEQKISGVRLYGNFDGISKTDFFLERIENKNSQYKGFGWGTILMHCMMKTLDKYCELNGYTLTRIFGTIGVGGGDTPERSMLLYSSFDNYLFDNLHKLHLQKQGFNLSERKLEYLIA